jgi:DNA-directed RNA polymerase beta' subunit
MSIKSFKFNLLSNEMSKNISVCEIFESKRCLYSNQVYDERLGAQNGLKITKCKTCKGTIQTCTGHHGIITLCIPIIHPMFVKNVIEVLKLICFTCHKSLVASKNVIPPIYCQFCNNIQPRFIIVKDDMLIDRIKVISDTDELILLSSDIHSIIYDANIDFLQYDPKDLIITDLSVLPITARPSVMINGNQCDDDLSYMYIEIVKLNRKLKKILEILELSHLKYPLTTNNILTIFDKMEKMKDKHLNIKKIKINTDIINKIFSNMNLYIKTIMNNNHQFKYQNDKNVKCIKSRLNGKNGLLRGHMMGKRVDFCARTVIGADASIGVDEIVLPKLFVETLTKPEYVNKQNINKINELLRQNKINRIKRNGELYTTRNFIIKEGDIVERHLQNGDFVILNRQPTLHTGSLLGLKLRIVDTKKDVKTIRFNIPAAFPLNADYDGDECNIHVPQSIAATAELEEILSVRKNTMMSKGQFTLMALSQDTIIGGYLLTINNFEIPKYEWNDIAFSISDYIKPWDFKIYNEEGIYTSHSLISLCFPPTFNYSYKSVVIENGILKSGVITKDHLGNKTFGIPRTILISYDENIYISVMNSIVKVVNHWLSKNAFSIGLGDCILNDDVKENIKDEVINNVINLTKNISDVDEKTNNIIIKRTKESDKQIYFILNNSKELGNKIVSNNMKPSNNLKKIVDSGAKGNYVNIFQIMAMLGQQILDGRRIYPSYLKTRSLPCYDEQDKSNIFYKDILPMNNDIFLSPINDLPINDLPINIKKTCFYDNRKKLYSKTQLRYSWTFDDMKTIECQNNHYKNIDYSNNVIYKPQINNTFKNFLYSHYENGGFIFNSLVHGLNPREFFYHAMAGRDGLISTSCSTATSGYLERRLTKMMEDVKVSYNGSIINGVTNKIIQFADNIEIFNNSFLTNNTFIFKDKLFRDLE